MRVAVLGAGVVLPGPDGRVTREDPALARVRKQMSRSAYLAALAVHDALAGVAVDRERTASFLAIGPSTGSLDDVLRILAASAEDGRLDVARFARRGVAACNPLLAFQLMNNFTLCHASIREGLQGPSGAFFGDPVAALRGAVRALDEVPWALAGVAESTWHPVARFEERQRGGEGPAAEGAVALLLAREGDTPLGWLDVSDGSLAAWGPRSGRPLRAAEAPRSERRDGGSGGRAGVLDTGADVPPRLAVRPLATGRGDPADVSPDVSDVSRGAGSPDDLVGTVFAWANMLEHLTTERPVRRSVSRDVSPHVSPRVRGARGARRAVITGVGAVSPFGVGVERLWDGLLGGAPAISPAPHLPGFGPVAWAPAGVDEVLAGVSHGRMCHDTWAARGWLRDRRLPWVLGAALEAWRHAGEQRGMALSLALGLEQAWLEDFLPLATADGLDWGRDPGGDALRYRAPLDLPARALAEVVPLGARRLVHASACAGGTLALAHAAAWIEAGEADVVLAGGGDAMLNPLGLAGLRKLGVVSPTGACRPFDARRDGIVVGEGAGCFVVEEEAAARRRGARILARVAGWGSTQDGYAPTAPRPGGAPARRAMEAALRRAGVEPADVGHVNAHGTGTPLNDEAEAAAIAGLLPGAPVGSFKGAIGHAMAAAGALELAGVLVAFARDVVPGTAGTERVDALLGLDVVRAPRPFRGRFVLKNSFGFGGQDASVLLERPA